MKGLLLKDFYMMKKCCSSALIVCLLYLFLILIRPEQTFFAFFLCILGGSVPTTLMGYEEQSKWNEYAEGLPYTRAQIVSSKYCIALIIQVVVAVFSFALQALGRRFSGGQWDDWNAYKTMVQALIMVSFISPAVLLPFMFRFGVNKGRLVYYLVVGMVCGCSVIGKDLLNKVTPAFSNQWMPLLCLVSMGIFALSWFLSIAFYKKRDI